MSVPNGVATGTATPTSSKPALPTVVGINFGNTYASIAVLTKVRESDLYAKSIQIQFLSSDYVIYYRRV